MNNVLGHRPDAAGFQRMPEHAHRGDETFRSEVGGELAVPVVDQVNSPADNSTRSSTCSPVQDRRLRGCWSHPFYEARSAVQAVGSPESTRVPQQSAKVNKLQLQHEQV